MNHLQTPTDNNATRFTPFCIRFWQVNNKLLYLPIIAFVHAGLLALFLKFYMAQKSTQNMGIAE